MNIDLTEAIATVREYIQEAVGFDGGVAMTHQATEVVTLVAPLIARQVADSIAAEIQAEAERRRRDVNEVVAAWGGVDPGTDGVRFGVEVAVRIAREWSPA